MTYRDTIEYLFGLRMFGQKLGLDTMRRLLHLMGDPQRDLRFIHIAGTNGKGSVAAMSHAILPRAGFRAGLYTSPHLVSFCERCQINGRPITQEDVVRLVQVLRPHIETVAREASHRHPTFFEVVTAMALLYFHEQQVEIVAWETGLGGRLDATNVVTPLVSVITNIALEHTQYLGTTIGAIAGEKAGIIKTGIPVVTAATNAEALAVIRSRCRELGCSITCIGSDVVARQIGAGLGTQSVVLTGCRHDYGELTMPLMGRHQVVNAATAVAALEATGLDIQPHHVRDGLQSTRWPGRFQRVNAEPPVILDGAHNPAAAEELSAAIRGQFDGQRVALILGVLRDKDFPSVCQRLAPLAARIDCVSVNNDRTCDPQDLARCCRLFHPSIPVESHGELKQAYETARRHRPDVIVITGSLFLVGDALNNLGLPVDMAPVIQKELLLQ